MFMSIEYQRCCHTLFFFVLRSIDTFRVVLENQRNQSDKWRTMIRDE